MNEVIAFPKNKIVRENPPDIDILEKIKEKSVKRFADDVVELIATNCYEEIETLGLDVDNEKFGRDFSVLVEILRATVYRNLELDHNLHEFMDNNVEITPMVEEGNS